MAPEIVLGAANFGRLGSQRAARDAVSFALDHGIYAIDTSPSYGDDHLSEKIIGSVCGNMSEIKVFSKVLRPPVATAQPKRAILSSVDHSLARLQRDRLDIVFVESAPDPWWADAALQQLCPLRSDGTIGEIGIFYHDNQSMTRQTLDLFQQELGTCPVERPCNLLRRDTCTSEQDFGQTFATAPLAGGLLTGKYSAPRSTPGRFDHFPDLLPAGAARKAEQLRQALDDLHGGLIGVALAWVMALPKLRGMVLGVRDTNQLVDCLTRLEIFRSACLDAAETGMAR